MAELNPNPYQAGDPLSPAGRMTAIVDTLNNLKETLSAVRSAGFDASNTAVFIGAEGAIQLDSNGVIRGIEGLKIFQNALCDEAELFDEFEQALKRGESVIAIPVADDEILKKPLVALLKSHNAHQINYWGKWQNEGLG